MSAKIKKGDTVEITTGKDRGKRGAVLRIDRERDRVVVERLNIVKKHQKPTATTRQGGIIDKEAPLHISNVALVHKGEKTRVGLPRGEREEDALERAPRRGDRWLTKRSPRRRARRRTPQPAPRPSPTKAERKEKSERQAKGKGKGDEKADAKRPERPHKEAPGGAAGRGRELRAAHARDLPQRGRTRAAEALLLQERDAGPAAGEDHAERRARRSDRRTRSCSTRRRRRSRR